MQAFDLGSAKGTTEMTDQPEPKMVQIRIDITWPDDTYVDAEPTNAFVFTDAGENICFAFGFAPPPPALEKGVKDGVLQIEATKKSAFVVPKSMVLNMTRELNNYINNNRQAFGIEESSDE